jgi:serine/threonine-protein kinase
MVGTTISHYEVLEKLGEGGMGLVYKARDLQLGRFVAIKVLIAGSDDSASHRARLIQEARAASSLNHPNIITIHDIVSLPDSECIVMEFVRGKTLGDLIEGGRIPTVDCLKLSMQIADALAAAHGIGIVHRDLKPANVMVTPEGLAKVLDFGLAKLAGEDTGAIALGAGFGESDRTMSIHASSQPKTAEGAIIGTVAYMSPEQAQGHKVDARSDIFSFGAVLYEMMTGERAFHGNSGLATLTAVLRDNPTGLSKTGVDAPPEMRETVMRCLRKSSATSRVCLELRPVPSAGVTRFPRYYEPLRHPRAPGRPVPHGRPVGPVIPDLTTLWGFPCCARFPCVRAAASTPVQRLGVVFAHLAQPCQPSPKLRSGRPAHRPFRDPMRRW